MSFNSSRGDIYLDEENHTAMCIRNDGAADLLGDKYSTVQKKVNEILGASGTSSTSMDVNAMARAAIRGDYGNGDERRRRLGSYYSIVQRRVNEMLS